MECGPSKQQPTTREERQQFPFENLCGKGRKQVSRQTVKQASDWRDRCDGFLFFVIFVILDDSASAKS
jgi:hypothetical protein